MERTPDTNDLIHWNGPLNWQNELAISIGNYTSLGGRPWSEVKSIEFLPGITVGAPFYEVPEHWLPPGVSRRLSFRRFVPEIYSVDAALVCDESIRRSLFGLALPRLTQTGVRKFKPSSWIAACRLLLRMARWVVENVPASEEKLWGHLTAAEWISMQRALTNSPKMRKGIRLLARHLLDLGNRGILVDFPSVSNNEVDANAKKGARKSTQEKSRRNQAVVSKISHTQQRAVEPYPLQFVSDYIGRALWLQKNLGVQLILCWEKLLEANARAAALGRRQSHPTTTQERRLIISKIDWRDAQGNRIEQLPWPISIREGGETFTTDRWPPRDAAAINVVVNVLQALNYSVTHFCFGARSSEVLSGTDDSLDFDEEGRYRGRTYKLVDANTGQERDWPVHPAAQFALQLQLSLAKAVRPESSNHLWVLLNHGSEPAGSPLRNVNEPVIQSVKRLGLDPKPGGARPHSHRWRHTTGYILAVSVAVAPQVLMDLFGHRDMEMTMRYMLSQPRIAQMTSKIAEEVSYVLSTEAITDAERGNAGGLAAPLLKSGLESLKMRRGESELGAATLREAAQILTFNGRHWGLVREGVLCTKLLGQHGPCTRGRGAPDPGACHGDCLHRLELARAKAQCEEALGILLNEYSLAIDDGMEMIVANLKGQILANLMRWDDVRERYLAISPTATEIWNSRASSDDQEAA